MIQKTIGLLSILVLAATANAGCIGAADEGTVAFYVKDAPIDDFQNLDVTFSQVRVHKGEPDNNETTSSSWKTVVDQETTIDLLAYSEADSRALMGNVSLEVGIYNQIEITVDSVTGTLESGEEVDVTVSSGRLRLVRAFNVTEDETTRIVLDFDLDRAVREQGNGVYRMTPVVGKVFVEEGASGAEGSVLDDGTGGAGDDRTASSQQTSGAAAPTGTVTTFIKDAPTDEFSEIWVTIEEVRVHMASPSNETDGQDDEAGNQTGNETDDQTNDQDQVNGTSSNASSGWITVTNTSRAVNLLAFQDEGAKAFLGDATLSAGHYTQIRLVVSDAWGIDHEDARVNFTLANDELKVVRSFHVTADNNTELVIDLDLDRSLTRTGPPSEPTWRMTPVVGKVLVDEGAPQSKQDVRDDDL